MYKCSINNCNKLSPTKTKPSPCRMHRSRWFVHKSYDDPINKYLPEGIVYRCKNHGDLTINQCRKHIYKHIKTKIYYSCKKCNYEKIKESRKTNPHEHRYHSLKNYKKNREENIKRMKRYRLDNLKKEKETKLKKSYGISLNEYEEKLKNQNNLCAICKNEEKNYKNLVVDHCHKTNKFRGLLCNKCNMGIGLLQDSIENLKSAITYLKASIL